VTEGGVAAVAAAEFVPLCMAQTLPYIVEGFMIDFKTKYYVSSTGHLTLQPS
jgi:hypothetical protein